jgi:hypothetical protein
VAVAADNNRQAQMRFIETKTPRTVLR